MANSKANGKAIKALLTHDYASQDAMETNLRGTKNLLTSPGKAALPLKKQRGNEEAAISAETSVILAAVESLKNSIEELRDDLQQNTLTIANIVKAVDFNSSEIKDLKEKHKGMTEEIKLLKATNQDLTAKLVRVEKKMDDQESYKRRWNLRLNGLKEEKVEDTRKKVAGVIIKIMPHWAEKIDLILDTVHRLGTPLNSRPRQIILQFSLRTYKEELWRATKGHPICRELNIKFAEDLTKEEREARLVLWPKVEQARKAGLRAIYKGRHAYINGQKITP